jgi:hypothetical protein
MFAPIPLPVGTSGCREACRLLYRRRYPPGASYPVQLGDRPLVLHVARVQRRTRLEQQNVGFLIGHWAVFDATRNDQELALLQPNMAIPELHAEPAFDHQEKLVLVVVVVPYEGGLELDQLHQLAVEFADNLRFPGVGETGEFFGEIYFVQVLASRSDNLVKGRAIILLSKTPGSTSPISVEEALKDFVAGL